MQKKHIINGCSIGCHIVFILIISFYGIYAQTFNLGGNAYIQVDGNWYTNHNGKMGDRIIADRIIIQLGQEMDINQMGLSSMNLEIVAGPIAENFYVLKVPSNADSFTSAALLSNVTG